ncbi:serine hydrolase [Streptomyces sp. NPDC057682]|uniref:D-alanyl-D-alanine carboxypeptidase n=1 Tax=Streptomyces sp. NPDC057682 TaxID=3346210 RepID=UPI00368EDFD5
MEEASVAGESPDKSEQQKSSGTTRSEADPRLAVFREPASPVETGERPDTATAVFRAPSRDELDGREESGASEPSDSSETPAASAASATSSTSEETDADGVPDGSDAAVTAPEGPVDATDRPEGERGAAEGAAGGSGSPEGAERSEDAESAAKGAEGGGEGPEDPEASEAPEASDGPAAAEDGDARLRAAVAAWVSKDGDEGDEDEVRAEARAEARAEGGSEAGDAPEAAAEDEPEATSEVKSEATSEPEAKADGEPEPEPEPENKPEVEPEGSDTDTDTDTDADPEPRIPRTREESAEKSAEAESAPGKPADKASAEKASAQSEPAGSEAAESADAEDKTGIDQATAVFKTPRLPRVDQPTTALKITPPPVKRQPAAEPAEGDGAPADSAAAERTSRFVPLRSDDVRPAPAPRTPEVPAPGPGAGQQPPAASLSGAERTRQQPMPPRPPLDLLAELTNTPPPPETPVRTAVRRVKIWTPLVLLLLLVFAIVQMVRPLPEPVLTMTAEPSYTFGGGDLKLPWPEQGQSAVTVDGVGTMGSAGAQKPAPIASVAKIMTAYVVLKGHPLTGKEEGEQITVDQQAEDESKLGDESTAPISKGQQFSEKELLQLLMIPSGNNAARLFARWDSSETEFVAKMNAAAKELGMTRTTYTDPSGLKKTTVSTADDQLKLAKAVMQNEVFREIVDTPQIKIDGIDTTIYNNNTILLEPGVSGIKTGSSTPAGGNLVWSANTVVDGKKLWIYGAVMGQQAGTGQPYDSLVMSLNNSLKLIKEAQKAVVSAKVVKKGDVVGYVDDGFGGRTPLVATADLKAKGWQGLRIELSVTDGGKEISRSMKAGTKVGVVTVGTGTGRVSAPVALQQDLKDPTFGQKLSRLG